MQRVQSYQLRPVSVDTHTIELLSMNTSLTKVPVRPFCDVYNVTLCARQTEHANRSVIDRFIFVIIGY